MLQSPNRPAVSEVQGEGQDGVLNAVRVTLRTTPGALGRPTLKLTLVPVEQPSGSQRAEPNLA